MIIHNCNFFDTIGSAYQPVGQKFLITEKILTIFFSVIKKLEIHTLCLENNGNFKILQKLQSRAWLATRWQNF